MFFKSRHILVAIASPYCFIVNKILLMARIFK